MCFFDHVWEITDKQVMKSAFESMCAEIKQQGLQIKSLKPGDLTSYQNPVLISRKCKDCGREEVKYVYPS